MSYPVSEEMVDAGEVGLNVATAGEGRPVLLLHGFPDSWQLWSHQIEALAAAGHRVIAPDLRGFGRSDRPVGVEQYAVPRLVADVARVLDHVGVERADVVGHDWGAGLAWQVALHLPDRVDRLAVLSVGHSGAGVRAGTEQRRLSWYMLWFLFAGVAEEVLPRDGWKVFREWAWDGVEAADHPQCARQIRDLSRPGALTAALNWYRANISPQTFVVSPAQPLPGRAVACPTLGVWSTEDPFLGRTQMVGSAEFVEGPWRYEELPGGHWVPTSEPERLSALLVDYLA